MFHVHWSIECQVLTITTWWQLRFDEILLPQSSLLSWPTSWSRQSWLAGWRPGWRRWGRRRRPPGQSSRGRRWTPSRPRCSSGGRCPGGSWPTRWPPRTRPDARRGCGRRCRSGTGCGGRCTPRSAGQSPCGSRCGGPGPGCPPGPAVAAWWCCAAASAPGWTCWWSLSTGLRNNNKR